VLLETIAEELDVYMPGQMRLESFDKPFAAIREGDPVVAQRASGIGLTHSAVAAVVTPSATLSQSLRPSTVDMLFS
jgi:hypothetical protein